MTKQYWKEVEKVALERREAVRQWLESLDTQRAEALDELAQIEQLLHSVAPFTSDQPLEVVKQIVADFVVGTDTNLADACRAVLQASKRYMTASQVRDALEASAYDLTKHSNPLASIHGILKRFDESGEVTMVALGNKASYRIAPERGRHDPAWRKYMKERARQANESQQADEAVDQMNERKRIREFEAKKKS